MKTAKVLSILTSGPEHAVITLSVEGAHTQVMADLHHVNHALLELSCHYYIDPFRLSEVEIDHPKIRNAIKMVLTSFPGVSVEYDEDHENFVAYLKDGDTGHRVEGQGKGPVVAIAKMITDAGFKPHPVGAMMDVTIHQWLVDFQYGFSRRSDEILRLEMEAFTNPDSGSW